MFMFLSLPYAQRAVYTVIEMLIKSQETFNHNLFTVFSNGKWRQRWWQEQKKNINEKSCKAAEKKTVGNENYLKMRSTRIAETIQFTFHLSIFHTGKLLQGKWFFNRRNFIIKVFYIIEQQKLHLNLKNSTLTILNVYYVAAFYF